MKLFKVTMEIRLRDDELNWIPETIRRQLVDDEVITDWSHEELEDEE